MKEFLAGGKEFYLERGEEKGCLLIHGFTGSPSHMRPLGEALAEEGITSFGVRLPGHGTHVSDLHSCSYQDWILAAYDGLLFLKKRCQAIYVAGLSMGGVISLFLAMSHPKELHGVIPICAPLIFNDPRRYYLPILKYFRKTIKKTGRGIKDPSAVECAYDSLSIPGAIELFKLCKRVKKGLSSIEIPALIIAAREDATVSMESTQHLVEHIGSKKKEFLLLENSYHVATLDYDAPLLNKKTIEFIQGVERE